MTDAPVTVTANATATDAGRGYAYRVRNKAIDRIIAFAEIDPVLDVDRPHAWLGSDHVKPYWQLDPLKPVFQAKLDEKLADGYLTPYVGLLDHTLMSYWEVYRAVDDVVAIRYDAASGDHDAHPLVGPPEYLGYGHSMPLLRAMTAFQLRVTGATRTVDESDVQNKRVAHVFERCGYEPQRRIDLPDKKALLMHCECGRFFDTVAENAGTEVGR